MDAATDPARSAAYERALKAIRIGRPEKTPAPARTQVQSGPAMAEPLLTAADVARLLNVDPAWVYRRKAEIGFVQLGGLVRFRPASVSGYVEKCEAGDFRIPLTHVEM